MLAYTMHLPAANAMATKLRGVGIKPRLPQRLRSNRPAALIEAGNSIHIDHRTRSDPRETSWLNPPWQATDNANPSQMGLGKKMAERELVQPHFHIGEYPNGKIVWPAIKYDPKKADMEVPAEPPPKFGPSFNQAPNGDDRRNELPPPEYPPDMFRTKEPADAPPEWHKEVGEVIPGLAKKPCVNEEMDLNNIKKLSMHFMSPHPIAPKGTTASYEVNDGNCDK